MLVLHLKFFLENFLLLKFSFIKIFKSVNQSSYFPLIFSFAIDLYLFFKETNTHTMERKRDSNIKTYRKFHLKVMVTFKEVWDKLYYTQHTLLSNMRQLPT